MQKADCHYDAEFVSRLQQKHRPTVARAISIVEAGAEQAVQLLDSIFALTGNAIRIGITGPPGAGKSTLVTKLAYVLRQSGKSVGVIAVDPTSPFSQGAVLGDRVRMVELEDDEQVFIRSMASRGKSGGLSAKTADAMDVLDAASFDILILESVGVGQVELDIEKNVDTTIVVLVPESGDQVQAIKAGLMEIADIYVLNKSDRPESSAILHAINTAIRFRGHHNHDWDPQVLATIANEGEGVAEVAGEINRHREFLLQKGILQDKKQTRLQRRVMQIVNDSLATELWDQQRQALLERFVQEMLAGQITPQQSARQLLNNFLE